MRIHRLPNDEWPALVRTALDGATQRERDAARTEMWQQVTKFVMECRNLPLGALSDDDAARQKVADGVMHSLERSSAKELRKWLDTSKPWWGRIYTIAYNKSIDVCRASPQNGAPRHQDCEWMREEATDPREFSEPPEGTRPRMSRGSLVLVSTSSVDDLIRQLDAFHAKKRVKAVSEPSNSSASHARRRSRPRPTPTNDE